jgi:hypothetical protein
LSRKDSPWLSALIRRALSKERDQPVQAANQAIPSGSMGRQPLAMVIFKIMVALSALGCWVSALTGIASSHTDPGGNLVITKHTPLGRVGAALAGGLAALFLYGLITKARITWKAGWVLLVFAFLSSFVSGLLTILNNQHLSQWVFVLFWIAGVVLVGTYWGFWWWKQRDYFSNRAG